MYALVAVNVHFIQSLSMICRSFAYKHVKRRTRYTYICFLIMNQVSSHQQYMNFVRWMSNTNVETFAPRRLTFPLSTQYPQCLHTVLLNTLAIPLKIAFAVIIYLVGWIATFTGYMHFLSLWIWLSIMSLEKFSSLHNKQSANDKYDDDDADDDDYYE